MAHAVRFITIEEEDVVRVGHHALPADLLHEEAGAEENDLVSVAGLFGACGPGRNTTAKIAHEKRRASVDDLEFLHVLAWLFSRGWFPTTPVAVPGGRSACLRRRAPPSP